MPEPTKTTQQAKGGGAQILIDLGPVLTFAVAFNVLQRIEATKDNAVYLATAIFIAATLAAVAYSKIKLGRIPPVLIVTAILVTAFGALTIVLREPSLIQIKATVINAFFAVALVVSLALRQNLWKALLRHVYTLPDRIWDILAWRWAGYFAAMAIANEIMRASMTFETWVTWRPWFAFPMFFLFTMANMPLLLKHAVDAEAPPADAA
jgi:intracellular septation protein